MGLKKLNNLISTPLRLSECTHFQVCIELASESKSSFNLDFFIKMDVSIIIVNYNVKEYIISCIESIYKQTDSNYKFEIIVIDNNSHDGSQKVIKEKFSNIKFIENKKNYGFSKAVNQASYYASGENLFILNPDTLFIENTINELLIELKKLDISGIIGPKIIDGNGKIIRSYWRKPTLKSAILSILHLDSLNFKKNYNSFTFNNISKVETLSGCAIFLPSKVFKELGGFNENLFWMEDIDLCARTERKRVFRLLFTEH